ncbi:hypothetical protein [Actinoplanes couchii]|uniref:Integral membrane protein n=1 Tax=Actinoplanes couchii TaxID=403638 RepID=A0ABQ3XLX6_9ACTN|nr:hypothetical protein [Actinoplanes couchii]MDR6319282.1 hypothetical protein [Actinoplanes couchii]GID59509.1 hypothetical protein Aco03nite_079130 [Actinoplanes couchii]
MRSNGETGVVPLRAMTAGETLDAAVALLRQRALPLLPVALVLAAGEQVLLSGLRAWAGMQPPYYYVPPRITDPGWWPVFGLGFAIEGFVIALLAAYAGAAAGPALLGRDTGHLALWKRVRPVPAVLIAVLVGAVCGATAMAGLVLWPLAYGLTAMATAVLTVDRPANPLTAVGRSMGRATRGGMRGVGVLILGYLTWLVVRLALGSGWLAVADLFASVSGSAWLVWAVPVAWTLANTVAYAALACLNAVLLLEVRIRTEGLDIAVNRSRSRGVDPVRALEVTR